MFQLIGITIDFFAFNTITKINIKSNENDFNYPFITLSFEDKTSENVFWDHVFHFPKATKYDIDCNVGYLKNKTREGEKGVVTWKLYLLLNCRQKWLHALMRWRRFPEKQAMLKLKIE